MATYAIAAIGVQNPHITRWYIPKAWGKINPHTHLGIAKVSDKEMNTPYGDPIWDSDVHTKEHFRGYGLGMNGQNQKKPAVAVEAMTRRIQIVTNECDVRCTSTDIFLVAALTQNGPGFNRQNLNVLMRGKDYIPRPTGGTYSLDWGTFIQSSDSAKENKNNQALIAQFASNVLYLESQGWDVPDDIDWKYVYSLTVTPITTEKP